MLRVPSGRKLAVGEAILVRSTDQAGAVLRRDEHGLYALSAICTHACCMVSLCRAEDCSSVAPNVEGCEAVTKVAAPSLLCPCHGSRFDVNGKVLSGPATVDLPHLLVKLEGDDALVDLSSPADENARVAV